MYALAYLRPRSLPEATALLREHPDALPLAGGMTLVPTLKQRLAAPSHLVDLSYLPELKGIEHNDKTLKIHAATPHAEVAASPIVASTIPALAELAGMIADPQVRNRGTLGGSVANNDPSADYPSAVLALDATVETTARHIVADDFFVDMFETALTPGELITAVTFRVPNQAVYLKHRHPASGYAVVGVFLARFGSDVRLAVTGAAPSVFRWREAEERLKQQFSIDVLEHLIPDPADLAADIHAPADYRANLVGTYARSAVAELSQPLA